MCTVFVFVFSAAAALVKWAKHWLSTFCGHQTPSLSQLLSEPPISLPHCPCSVWSGFSSQ